MGLLGPALGPGGVEVFWGAVSCCERMELGGEESIALNWGLSSVGG